MASSTSLPRLRNYDVFLSFRGDDTRKTFVSHLYAAFRSKGIFTFKDDRELEIGDYLPDKIPKAIGDSRFAVVVLSKNYASSRWCLEELRLIIELKRKKQLEVVPIFYEVEPSDVKHQKGSFADAFKRYRGPQTADKVPRWREALEQIADIKGKHSTNCEDEATMIAEIVEDISRQLLPLQPIDFSNLVGMEAHMERLNPLLNIESLDEVRMIGIWGMGGVGKTALAKYLYDRFSRLFQGHCFIENVKNVSKEHGLPYLQGQFLSNILGREHIKFWSVEVGLEQIKARLRELKVFAVLDDVDNVKQLHAVAKETSWFGRGSRIIVTTRDKGLLRTVYIYNARRLENDEALRLFKKIAFGGGHPPSDGFEKLSIRASRLAQGLPLAIEAFGLYLSRMTTAEEWEYALQRITEAPDQNVMDILKISYKGLEKPDKIAFLHVACLFNGDPVRRVTTLLEHGELGVNFLVEKSLVDISTDGCVIMHDLVEQMGRQIVRKKSRSRPWERTILADPEGFQVLANNVGTEQIECMALHMCEMPSVLSMSGSVFQRMHNLKFLKFYKHSNDIESKLQLIPEIDLPSSKLRLLHWDAYPSATLPARFHSECLVELNLRYSNIEYVMDVEEKLLNLRRLDLTGSKNLRELPRALQLEELIVEGSTRLWYSKNSIGNLSSLRKLHLIRCDALMDYPIYITDTYTNGTHTTYSQRIILMFSSKDKLKSLENLSIEGHIYVHLLLLYGQADHFSFVSEQKITDELMTVAHQTPLSMTLYLGIKSLHIKRFGYKGDGNSFRCHSLSEFLHLTQLKLVNLEIKEIPDDIGHLQFLEKLDLSGNDFANLPASMEHLSKLEYLVLCNCRYLEALPKLAQLETLTISDCVNLRTLLTLSDVEEYRLLELELQNCNLIQSLSDQLSHFTSLTKLDLSRHDFETMPTSIKQLSSLTTLCLNHCENLKSVAGLPLSLKYLYAQGCASLETSSLSLYHLV